MSAEVGFFEFDVPDGVVEQAQDMASTFAAVLPDMRGSSFNWGSDITFIRPNVSWIGCRVFRPPYSALRPPDSPIEIWSIQTNSPAPDRDIYDIFNGYEVPDKAAVNGVYSMIGQLEDCNDIIPRSLQGFFENHPRFGPRAFDALQRAFCVDNPEVRQVTSTLQMYVLAECRDTDVLVKKGAMIGDPDLDMAEFAKLDPWKTPDTSTWKGDLLPEHSDPGGMQMITAQSGPGLYVWHQGEYRLVDFNRATLFLGRQYQEVAVHEELLPAYVPAKHRASYDGSVQNPAFPESDVMRWILKTSVDLPLGKAVQYGATTFADFEK